jgi:hypothetical protein
MGYGDMCGRQRKEIETGSPVVVVVVVVVVSVVFVGGYHSRAKKRLGTKKEDGSSLSDASNKPKKYQTPGSLFLAKPSSRRLPELCANALNQTTTKKNKKTE